MTLLPIKRAHQIEMAEPGHEWLIEGLWGADAVGIIGGEPKCCKSLLSLSMAVAVASGRPCLGRFPVKRQGGVLLFAAEDALPVVRQRLEAICAHWEAPLNELMIWAVTAPSLRLDKPEDCRRLASTVEAVAPALLILDPFVRLHRVDENVSAAVAPLLDALRTIQRRYGCAIAVVHHARKGAGNARGGQALRGSSEFHAWVDSGLIIRRTRGRLLLSAEHRAQSSLDNLSLRLITSGPAPVLVSDEPAACAADPSDRPAAAHRERVLGVMRSLTRPASTRDLRPLCKMRTNTLCGILHQLAAEGVAVSGKDGWRLLTQPAIPGSGRRV